MSNDTCINEFIKIIGHKYVNISSDKNSKLKTTFPTSQEVLGVLYPQNRSQVENCIKIANHYKIKLYPISRGKNIGLGGKVPVESNCFILDLSLMNKILEYNEELAYIRIEAGVTQAQISEYLKSVNSNHVLSITGSFPESSIIGNVLERGDTSGPYKERVEHICNLDVILGNGESLQTGFGRYKHSKLNNVSKFGVGADYTGIFIQSNFSVVISLTIWLSPRPKHIAKIGIRLQNNEQLEAAIDTIRTLELKGVIDDCSFWNNYKILSICTKSPFKLSDPDALELQNWATKTSTIFQIGKWNATIVLRSESKLINKERIKIIKQALKNKVDKIISTEDLLFKIVKMLQKPIQKLTRKNLSAFLSLSSDIAELGIPNKNNIKSLYWGKKNNINSSDILDPEKDKVGFIWGCIAAPYKGNDILLITNLIENIMLEYGFLPNICILGISKRMVTIAAVIIYDRENIVMDNKALECHNKFMKEAINKGYFPNRLGIQSMHLIPNSNSYYELLIKDLKANLDPNNIISPGRYIFNNNYLE